MMRTFAFVRRFGRARQGATAVEFALVAFPFLALVFAVLELGLIFLAQTALDNAIDDAGRKIRTGQLQQAGGTAATFKTSVCAEMTWLSTNCASKLSVDVKTYKTFAEQSSSAPPVKNGAVDASKLSFIPGAGQDIVLVRAYYEWKLFAPLTNAGLVNLGGNKRLLISTDSFRNEPFT